MSKKFIIFFTTLIFISSAFLPHPVAAAKNNEALNDALYDFCEKRQGDTMNLETWYAGKCGTNNTFTGEGTGFGDIIILHALEFMIGEQEKTGEAIFDELFKKFNEKKQGQNQPLSLLATIDITNQAVNQSTSNNSLLSSLGQLVSSPFKNPPAQTYQYVASVKDNMAKHKIVQPSYAQEDNSGGYGFSSLQGFLPIWRAFRNIAYMIFVLLFLVYGFMIMFRVKINPQTSVNIQQALPKLIFTLFLITFSYAIIGLMFDLVWLLFFLGFSALETFNVIQTGPVAEYGNILANVASGRAGLILSGFFNTFIAFVSGIPGAIGAITGLPAGITGIFWGVANALSIIFVGGIPTIIVGAILLIATLISYGKLFFKLIGAYITVIINLIFAPLILLGNVFPGSNSVGNWLRNTFANLIVFPATSFLLLFSYLFMVQPLYFKYENITQGLLQASAAPRVPVLFPYQGAGASGMVALVGLGLLFMAPKYVDMIKEAFQVEPFKYGSDLGRELGTSFDMTRRGITSLGTVMRNPNAPEFIKQMGKKIQSQETNISTVNEFIDNTTGRNRPNT